ncbi:HlyIII-domain-containing protein [Mytilinidion resinicola]|uniref:HlyIII-domain-containing protein n=1 Tax=Mytilinidion resinicola TaxID=574789 RepID=A0A6A6Y128_9PEZI|nr:HlyIII-domain-containing protein [Mytilinidion resinicola]KAF2802360.1 HlyIII-domain-containing protein [Mytilinidion resinicola]
MALTKLFVPRLLNSDQVPSWYAHNDYIHTGYRPVTKSFVLCVESLAYLHNETVNIYSHLVPAVLAALLGNYVLARHFNSHFPKAFWKDQLVFHIHSTTSVVCFGISDLWGCLDYVTIVLQILGSFISGIYVGSYCEPNLQKNYWSMVHRHLSFLAGFIVLNPRLQGTKSKNIRLSAFVATGFSAFAPIIHAACIFPYEQLDKQAGLRYYYLEGLLIIIGVMLYATHFPESWKPERFDIWGASRQIFHSFIVLGVFTHLYGALDAFEWNYVNQRCRPH